MAIVKSLGLGKARGSAGEFTYSTIQGRTIARTKPAHVHNPNTEAQQAQRTKMRDVVVAWRDVGQRFEKLWTNKKKYHSAYNSFVSANIANNGSFTVSPRGTHVFMNNGFTLGQGQYRAAQLTPVVSDGERDITINVSDNLFFNLKVGDVVGCVFLDHDGEIDSVKEVVLSQDDLEGVNDKISLTLRPDADEFAGYAPYWYSPSRNLSTDCVVTII